MQVLRRLGWVVGGRAMIEVGVRDESELLQQFERAIDRRHVDASGTFPHPGRDVLWSGMAKLGHGLEDELALRGQSITLRAQSLLELHRVSLGSGTSVPGLSASSGLLSVSLEPGPDMRLQRLPHRSHVERPQQVALDEPVEPVPGRVFRG